MEAVKRTPPLTSTKFPSGPSIGGTAGTAKRRADNACSGKRTTSSLPSRRSAGCVPELVTPIGSVKLGDRLQVRWVESGGDGKFYPATVVALSAKGATVAYAETADWNEWKERLALSDCESLSHVSHKPQLLSLPISRLHHTTYTFCCGSVVPGRVKRDLEQIEWVQCECPDCGKWRILPASVRVSDLPKRFECHMCHWNKEGASCDTAEDTVESAHWLDPTTADVAPIAAGKRLAESTDQMLAQLEAQIQSTLERKKNRQRQRKRQRQAAAPATAASTHAPILCTQPCTVVPLAMLPSNTNDPAATTNFAALFAMGLDRPIILPALTPSIQRLYDVGVKPHLALDLCRFSVARHRLYKQKISGSNDDEALLAMLDTPDKVEILRTKSFCNVCRCLDRVSAYVISEVIRPHALSSPEPDLPGMLFNLCIVRAYINDSVRASFMGRFDFRKFDPSQFVRKVQRCLVLSGRDPDLDIASSAYNVGTFRKYHAAGEQRRGSGTKKRSVAHFFGLLATKIPAAVAAMCREPRSAAKTFGVLHNMLEIATFPAYNITLDLGYYDRTLCDEDQFHYIGPGACPTVHFLRAEPWVEKWVQLTDASSLKCGQRVRIVQLSRTIQQPKTITKSAGVKTEPDAMGLSDAVSQETARSVPVPAAVHSPLAGEVGTDHQSSAPTYGRWVYGTATHGIKAKQGSNVRVRWDCGVPSDIKNSAQGLKVEGGGRVLDAQTFSSALGASESSPHVQTESVVHKTCLFKRILRPPPALSDKLYTDVMVALRDALPGLFAAIVRVALGFCLMHCGTHISRPYLLLPLLACPRGPKVDLADLMSRAILTDLQGVDMEREFAECPMTRMADGQRTLNLQYVEGALCEFRKFVTEQPALAVLCGKTRVRSGLKYAPKCGDGGVSEAAADYKKWLDVVQRCVVATWTAPDRTDRMIWAPADLPTPDDRGSNTAVESACSPVVRRVDTASRASSVDENACRLHPTMSTRAAAELGVIWDIVDATIAQVVASL